MLGIMFSIRSVFGSECVWSELYTDQLMYPPFLQVNYSISTSK